MAKVKLIDVTKCCACKGCQTACKNWNQLPAQETTFVGSMENPADFDANTWCRVMFNEHDGDPVKWYFSKFQCMHCSDPACATICPVNAIAVTSNGSVRVDIDTCIGCGACVGACPFDVPRIGNGKMFKCTQCFDRTGNNLVPACATTCPTGAVSFGDKDAKISEANDRVSAISGKHPNAQVYGVEELGGLGTVYVLPDAPDKCGLPADPQVSLSTYFWNVALAPVKTLAAVGLTVGFMHKFVEKKAADMQKDNVE